MAYQNVFQRYELKYILTSEQKEKVLRAMEPYMAPDQYGHTTIRNIYFDTNNYRLIRHSIEKPAYKEKLRIRSYKQTNTNSTVFVELKKKYQSIVYKRRLSLPAAEAMEWLCHKQQCPVDSQISKEVSYFLTYYQDLHPTAFLSYDREAYYSLDDDDFRVTFDDNILCRTEDLSLESDIWGTPLLDAGMVLMEIKCAGCIPLWMTKILSENHIYKISFSKYGTAYRTIIYPKLKEANLHA